MSKLYFFSPDNFKICLIIIRYTGQLFQNISEKEVIKKAAKSSPWRHIGFTRFYVVLTNCISNTQLYGTWNHRIGKKQTMESCDSFDVRYKVVTAVGRGRSEIERQRRSIIIGWSATSLGRESLSPVRIFQVVWMTALTQMFAQISIPPWKELLMLTKTLIYTRKTICTEHWNLYTKEPSC